MKYTKEYLEELVKDSTCIWEVIEKTDMSKQEGNYTYISNTIKRLGVDTSHFIDKRTGGKIEKDLSEYLVKGKYLTLNGNRLKSKLYKAGLKKPICELCGQDEYWRGKKISLILDHIDGDRENNELVNLQIVCPNCNATLDTHCGKNRKIERKPISNRVRENLYKDKNIYNNIRKPELIKIIKNSNIDFNKYGWKVELAKITNKTPQYIGKFVSKNIPELWEICYKQYNAA